RAPGSVNTAGRETARCLSSEIIQVCLVFEFYHCSDLNAEAAALGNHAQASPALETRERRQAESINPVLSGVFTNRGRRTCSENGGQEGRSKFAARNSAASIALAIVPYAGLAGQFVR